MPHFETPVALQSPLLLVTDRILLEGRLLCEFKLHFHGHLVENQLCDPLTGFALKFTVQDLAEHLHVLACALLILLQVMSLLLLL